uniref:Uncharacterized protein n=1 Tax=Rhizophora mucronata TaxID=61149 RepID=A0A2P2NMT0_RHIMU
MIIPPLPLNLHNCSVGRDIEYHHFNLLRNTR